MGDDSFFLEVADKAMAGLRREEVAEEKTVEENPLGAENHGSHEDSRGVEFEECEEVHPFVECFFQERFNLFVASLARLPYTLSEVQR